MKALTFEAPGRVSFQTVADPEIRDPGDVVVRVERTAICGSDLHVFLGRERGIDPGTPMGHEFSGEVVELGDSVRSLSKGDRVVCPFTTSCGSCFYCRNGLTSRCSRGELFGWVENGIGLPGAQAEYVRVPMAEHTAVRLPEDIDEDGALFLGDVLATGFFCAELAGVGPGGVYAVVGCGPVGLLAIVAARELGASEVVAIDRLEERLRLASHLGASPFSTAGSEGDSAAVEHLRELTEGRGADAVLEVVGSPEASRLAYDLVRPGGVIAAVGVHTEPSLAFSPGEAYDKNLTYRAGRCPARAYMDRLLPLVGARRYDLASIVSHRLPLEDAPRGYALFEAKRERCTKVVLTP